MGKDTTNVKKLPLDLIDDPKIRIRDTVDDTDINELMNSMNEIGLLEPIVVRQVANRYEIIAGHRRTRAARLLGWQFIEAKIIQASEEEVFALRLAENLQRKDINPVDEACFIGEIMLKYHKTPEDMVRLLKRSPAWISDRLEVFEMPDFMKEHLRLKKYPLGAALWIFRIENENTRRYYADWAAINGVTVAAAHRWYENLKASQFVLDTSKEVMVDQSTGRQTVRTKTQCAFCGQDVYLDEANSVWIHPTCFKGPAQSQKG